MMTLAHCWPGLMKTSVPLCFREVILELHNGIARVFLVTGIAMCKGLQSKRFFLHQAGYICTRVGPY